MKSISQLQIKNIVILTGAGISAESGIKTFRDSNGLWESHSIEEVATYGGYLDNPDLVHQFYNQRRCQLISGGVQPNAAHKAIAQLVNSPQYNTQVITQNIDNLHEASGIEPIHMHGELLKIQCENCGYIRKIETDVNSADQCQKCHSTGRLRPYVVWFGEMPRFMDEIYEHLKNCDLFISIGTSGQVYPAAQFVQEARRVGQAFCIELNIENTSISHDFHEHRQGPASEIVPLFISELLKG